MALKKALLDLNASLKRIDKLLNQIIQKIKKDQFQAVSCKLLLWDLKEELAYELFLTDIELALDVYLKRFQMPLKEHLLGKFEKFKEIVSKCYKLSACSVKSFR